MGLDSHFTSVLLQWPSFTYTVFVFIDQSLSLGSSQGYDTLLAVKLILTNDSLSLLILIEFSSSLCRMSRTLKDQLMRFRKRTFGTSQTVNEKLTIHFLVFPVPRGTYYLNRPRCTVENIAKTPLYKLKALVFQYYYKVWEPLFSSIIFIHLII